MSGEPTIRVELTVREARALARSANLLMEAFTAGLGASEPTPLVAATMKLEAEMLARGTE